MIRLSVFPGLIATYCFYLTNSASVHTFKHESVDLPVNGKYINNCPQSKESISPNQQAGAVFLNPSGLLCYLLKVAEILLGFSRSSSASNTDLQIIWELRIVTEEAPSS